MAIHVYTGDGKGKTTCASGLAARFAATGKKVAFFRFLKCEPSGECESLKNCVDFYRTEGTFGFLFQMSEAEKQDLKVKINALWQKAKAMPCDLLVLDEILCVISEKLIAEDDVLDFLQNVKAEVVLTGRGASEKMVDAADYVTEMKKIKHPFDNGEVAREGIEF
ncbi:MAG: cob(I)yrinic acid a,c-diamide adenosyltransferase [Clostridia bacterium]|nr:cob(I)yrinic acid a,c-diamide adenosyltransferase [Clostridia bacterium]